MQRDGTRDAIGFLLPLALAIGVLVLAGATSISTWKPAEGQRQLVYLAFGIAALLAAQWVDYRALLVLSPLLFALSLVPVLYTVVGRFVSIPFVEARNNACAWMIFGPISFQPAEVTKIALVLLLAWTLRGDNRERSLRTLVRTLLIAGVAMGLILQQPDLGTVLTMVLPTMVMVFVAGVRKRHLFGLVAIGIAIAPLLWFSGPKSNVPLLKNLPELVKPYQRNRVIALFSNDPGIMSAEKYQQQRALEAMASGGLWGQGRGNIPVGRYVPEAHTDMILALIGEQYGLLGIGVIILCYGLLFGAGAAIASEHREQSGKLLAIGVVTLLTGQALLNISVAMRIMPVTGVTLPFVSYGGSSLVASFLAIGFLVNVARNQHRLRL